MVHEGLQIIHERIQIVLECLQKFQEVWQMIYGGAKMFHKYLII